MIIKNVNGQSYQFFPGILAAPNLPGSTIVTSKQINGNKITFFAGTMPSNLIASSATLASITASYTKLCETPEFGLTYTYNVDTKKRYIRKTQVDALEMEYTTAGTIGFAVISVVNPELQQECIIITDSIGQWGDNQMPIILDNKVGTLGSRNLFKNVSIEITDKSTNA